MISDKSQHFAYVMLAFVFFIDYFDRRFNMIVGVIAFYRLKLIDLLKF